MHQNAHCRWGCWAQSKEGHAWGQVLVQPELGPGILAGTLIAPPTTGCSGRDGEPAFATGPFGVRQMELPPATPSIPFRDGLASIRALLTFWGPSWLGSSGASSPISSGCRNLRTKLRFWWKAWKASWGRADSQVGRQTDSWSSTQRQQRQGGRTADGKAEQTDRWTQSKLLVQQS